MAKRLFLMVVSVALVACAGIKRVNLDDFPPETPVMVQQSTATFSPTLSPTPNPTLSPTHTLMSSQTNTPSPTRTNTPTQTPTTAATLLAGGSGQLIGNCTERTQASAIYLYDLTKGDLQPAQPEFRRSPDETSLWITDRLNLVSPAGDVVVWQKCASRNVAIEDPYSQPVMGDYANIQCGQ